MATLVSRDTTDTFAVRKGEVRECPERRTRAFKVFELPPEKDGRKRFRVGGQIGPVHYRLDPERETEAWKEIDLALVPQKSGPWDWACITNGYQVHVANRLRLNGQGLLYAAQFRRLGAWLRMAPLALAWENAAGERQEIGQPQADIEPQVEDGGIEWRDCFGKGLHYRYNLHPDRFFKTLVVESAEALPKPTIGGRGLRLTLTLAWAWSRDAGPQEFARGQRVEALPTAVEARVPDEECSDPGLYPHKREERDCFWVREPQAWDSAEEPSRWPVAMRLRRYGGGVCADFSLGAREVADACYPLMVDTDISEEQIGHDDDDMYSSGNYYPYGAYNYGDYYYNAFGKSGAIYYCAGWRYTTVPIPQGATITAATLSHQAQAADTGTTYITIAAEDVDDAASIADKSHTPAHAYGARTSAVVDWTVGNWSAESIYNTPDFAAVVEEVVAREGWESNNAIVILHYAANSEITTRRRPYDYGRTTSKATKFNCSYTEAGGGTVYEVEGDALASAFADATGTSLSFLRGDGAAAGSAEATGTPIGFLSGDALAHAAAELYGSTLRFATGDAEARADAEAQPSAVLNATADASAGAGTEGAAVGLSFATGDAVSTGAAEAAVTRTLTAAGDAQATAAAEAAAARVVLLYVDAASQSDAEAGAALTHSATGDAAAGGNAEAAAGAVLLITGDAAAAGHAEAAAALAHLLFGDAAASALAEATPSLAASLDGDAAGMAGASGAPQIAYLLHGDAQAISSAAEEQLVRAVLLPIAATDVQRLMVEATALARTGIGAAQLSRDELSADSLATLRVIADELRRHGIDVDLL